MITIKELKLMLGHFSETDLVEAYELDKDDVELSNILGIFKSVPTVVGEFPICGEAVGHISTLISETVIYGGE